MRSENQEFPTEENKASGFEEVVGGEGGGINLVLRKIRKMISSPEVNDTVVAKVGGGHRRLVSQVLYMNRKMERTVFKL